MNCERCRGKNAMPRPSQPCTEKHDHLLCRACRSSLFRGGKKPIECPGYDPEVPDPEHAAAMEPPEEEDTPQRPTPTEDPPL